MEIFASEENTVLISVNGDFIKVWKDGKELEIIEDLISKANHLAIFANEYEYHYAATFLSILDNVFELETEIVEIETFLDIW